jgi:hypothetical protein
MLGLCSLQKTAKLSAKEDPGLTIHKISFLAGFLTSETFFGWLFPLGILGLITGFFSRYSSGMG